MLPFLPPTKTGWLLTTSQWDELGGQWRLKEQQQQKKSRRRFQLFRVGGVSRKRKKENIEWHSCWNEAGNWTPRRRGERRRRLPFMRFSWESLLCDEQTNRRTDKLQIIQLKTVLKKSLEDISSLKGEEQREHFASLFSSLSTLLFPFFTSPKIPQMECAGENSTNTFQKGNMLAPNQGCGSGHPFFSFFHGIKESRGKI